jgi:protocatechuate 3,4-dioxygenase beta subunit
LVLGAAFILLTAPAAVAQGGATSPMTPPPAGTTAGSLHIFQLPKPPASVDAPQLRDLPNAPVQAPQTRESLRTMIGVGYVQGADWGSEILAGGMVAGAQVQLNTLITSGREGFMFDSGSLSIFDPNTKWRIEAGDVFSHLRGAALGGRVSWPAAGNRRPAIALYSPRKGTLDRGTVVTYRDQLQLWGQTLLDAEVASDKSYLLRNRFTISPIEIETFYRRQRVPLDAHDVSVSGGVTLWRGVVASGGIYNSAYDKDRNDWRMLSLRLPISRAFDLTFERAFAGSGETAQTTSAVMANVTAGNLRFFHRYQTGEYEYGSGDLSGTLERQQIRSMSTYTAGPRLNLTLQLATQRADTGQIEHWEELQATMKLTRTTTLRTVTAVPDVGNAERFQAYFRQELPRQLAVQADYGRISAYQSIARELDRPRFKVMLFKTVDIATPARGATMSGRVLDHSGRAVAGARVKLGGYTADTNANGSYSFAHVPRGDYELSLDPSLLPADYAWDGRVEPIHVTSSHPISADLKVAPLNAIHGRVYVDRNANGRYDAGEAVAHAVLQVGDRVTATDSNGAYSFYNLWPNAYVVRLTNLPSEFLSGIAELSVTLLDGAPVTGADFRVIVRDKPVIWAASAK